MDTILDTLPGPDPRDVRPSSSTTLLPSSNDVGGGDDLTQGVYNPSGSVRHPGFRSYDR